MGASRCPDLTVRVQRVILGIGKASKLRCSALGTASCVLGKTSGVFSVVTTNPVNLWSLSERVCVVCVGRCFLAPDGVTSLYYLIGLNKLNVYINE